MNILILIFLYLAALHANWSEAVAENRVHLTVTKNFSDKLVDGEVLIAHETTVVQVLKAKTDVETSFGDAFVNRIARFPGDVHANGY